jgi:DNA-binding HxlR family transcriptional regulator
MSIETRGRTGMSIYRQFCPVAKAAEIFAERWTPLILRELLMGSHRFSEIEAGVPRISKSLLTQRLRFLERAGLVERRPSVTGHSTEYHLTQAGEELYDVVEQLGIWGQRWANLEIGPDDIDPNLLMWDMRRRIHREQLPERRIVVQFDFTGSREGRYWLILERHDVSVCLDYPGYEPDLFVTADSLAFHRIWMGQLSFAQALRHDHVRIDGPRDLAHAFPSWLALNMFAHIEPVRDSPVSLAPR